MLSVWWLSGKYTKSLVVFIYWLLISEGSLLDRVDEFVTWDQNKSLHPFEWNLKPLNVFFLLLLTTQPPFRQH